MEIKGKSDSDSDAEEVQRTSLTQAMMTSDTPAELTKKINPVQELRDQQHHQPQPSAYR